MTYEELAGHMDITMLGPGATEKEVAGFLERARRHPFAAACVPPCHVGLASAALRGTPVGVCTVAGFPLGFSAGGAKLFEARRAVEAGADEVDVVMNIGLVRSGHYAGAAGEVAEIVEALPGTVIKVIIETCYLTDEEKRLAAEAVAGSGAGFVKTSTGFGPGGATEEDVRLLSDVSAGRVGVKAAGGIRDLSTALAMISAGAERIGTSAGFEILAEFNQGEEERRGR